MSSSDFAKNAFSQVTGWLAKPSVIRPTAPAPRASQSSPTTTETTAVPPGVDKTVVIEEPTVRQPSPIPPVVENEVAKTSISEMGDNNFEDIADDAAATAFDDAFSNLLMYTPGTEEDISETLEELVGTLNDCVTKKATVDEMVSSVFDTAAAGKYAHYTAAGFLVQLCLHFTKEIENFTFKDSLLNHLRSSLETSENNLRTLTRDGDIDPSVMVRTRNAIIFATELSQKLLHLPQFEKRYPALMYDITSIVNMCFDTRSAVRVEYTDNCACAVQVLRIIGPTFDEKVRNDPSVVTKFRGLIPAVYDNIRRMLITGNELTPHIRQDIIKILEFRASRWGDVPPPDQPMQSPAEQLPGAVDEVDVNQELTKEELEFCDQAFEDLELDEILHDEGLQYGYAGEDGGQYQDENQNYGQEYVSEETEEPPRFVYNPNDLPPEVMSEFRRRLNKPDGSGDRSTGTN
ncbi:uncharacterized protein LOC129591754 isoform X2 [Paramacrobiotus metropolitanus]|uniref:uncharacterized protein LOC129591754 isoform X2 n=1 Tax=Paramacrobiotus metropolitanus TaxID=2943436 RepID=UPI002445EF24|nr:uncharacterized protein LOC129591754 isoform X2 [Paramacrobiotus metropolitanus]